MPLCTCEAETNILRLQNETLENDLNATINSLRIELKSSHLLLKEERVRNSDLAEQVDKLETTLKSFHKQIAGHASGAARRNKVTANKCKSKVRKLTNVILPASSTVRVLRTVSSTVFQGVETFSGQRVGIKKKSSTYVRLPLRRKLNSQVSLKEIGRRSSLATQILALVSGCPALPTEGNVDEDQMEVLLARMAKTYPLLFRRVAERSGMTFFRQMSPEEGVNLCSLLRLPMKSFRSLRIVLSNMGFNFLPSEPKMRSVQRELTQHLDESQVCVESEYMVLSGGKIDKVMGTVPVVKCKDLVSYITSVYFKTKTEIESAGGKFLGDSDAVQVAFAGDRGGASVKFHFELISCGNSGSVFDVHIFSMYEASDCAENMEKVLREYEGVIREMQREDFRIDGRKVKIFLGGICIFRMTA